MSESFSDHFRILQTEKESIVCLGVDPERRGRRGASGGGPILVNSSRSIIYATEAAK